MVLYIIYMYIYVYIQGGEGELYVRGILKYFQEKCLYIDDFFNVYII